MLAKALRTMAHLHAWRAWRTWRGYAQGRHESVARLALSLRAWRVGSALGAFLRWRRVMVTAFARLAASANAFRDGSARAAFIHWRRV